MRTRHPSYPTSSFRTPDGVRPSSNLLPSSTAPSRHRRLAHAGVAGAAGLAAAGGLAAIVATSATAAPAPTATSTTASTAAPSTAHGVGSAATAQVVRYEAEQAAAAQAAAQAAAAQAAAQQAAAQAAAQAAQQAAQQAAAQRAAAQAASRSTSRAPLSGAGSFSGEASWYGPGFAGHSTASGTAYDPSALTAASRTLPLGSHLRVCHGGACVTVLINDRGPYVGGRVLDLSEAAAEEIGISGVGWVTCTPV